jgi:hypothetical protein
MSNLLESILAGLLFLAAFAAAFWAINKVADLIEAMGEER